jgi:hypothetical protein
MQLKEFLENFIEHNSVVRLVYKDKSGHRIVHDSWNDVSMEHQILKGKGKDRHYINNKVLGICSILVHGAFPEAINIVIEELENQPMVEEVHEDFLFSITRGLEKK